MLYLSHPTVTNPTTESSDPVSAPEDRTCSRCGLTERVLRTEGLLGCSNCYETFADLVAQAAEALHGVTVAPPVSPEAGIDTAAIPASTAAAEPRRLKALSWLPRRMQAHLSFPPDSSLPSSKTKKSGST